MIKSTDDLVHRLRAEADAARVAAPPHLRARTMAALQQAARDTASPRHSGRLAAYAIACAAVAVLAAVPGLHRPAIQPAPPRNALASFDFGAWAAQPFPESPWDTLLLDEAHLLAEDARHVGEYLLAKLPLPLR